ncbi:MAG: NADH-quinone oxidoreductase subunit NuoB [Spirochaetes bacterium]|nr:NADH-quinone oxidoreductase subunit NuoB [Spirochaetota bacterium]
MFSLGEQSKYKGLVVGSLNRFFNLSRSYSFWSLPFATACCGIEYMSMMSPHFDIARFGAERPTFSPRQTDTLIVLGTISYKMAPVLKEIYEQICEPKWVLSVGVCASLGGMFNTYSTLQGIDKIIPVSMYVPFCPPRPEVIIQAIWKLQKKVQQGKGEEFNTGAPAYDQKQRERFALSADESEEINRIACAERTDCGLRYDHPEGERRP